MEDEDILMTVKDASIWASEYLGKTVSSSNISYLVQYGLIRKFSNNGTTKISQKELINYYQEYHGQRQNSWKDRLGEDLNWSLSFDTFKEAETTKHVHRLHPYKGKFIPQLVEYFLDDHVDKFKKDVFFKKGDIILDPFSGSGTTLVQANELGMNAIGIDISAFNAMVANCKIAKYDLIDVSKEISKITHALRIFLEDSHTIEFENKLLESLHDFNDLYFPVPEFKYKVKQGEIDEDIYGEEKAKLFLPIYNKLVEDYNIKLGKVNSVSFLEKWYFQHILNEIEFVHSKIMEIQNINSRNIISVILSRTIRSCRATTHSDLATLLEPITTTYYCTKHGKICKPIFSILKRWQTYTKDTISRLVEFNSLRSPTYQYCLIGDARTIDILGSLEKANNEMVGMLMNQKIKGIFSSPPYVGMIDYHEQHAYAYDLFGFERQDELEIGPMFKGKGKVAQQNYIEGISSVLKNCVQFLADDYDIFLVANDKYNMYPTISEKSGMEIINQFKRPVLNRTERDKAAYSEIIFHLKYRK